MSGHKFFTGLPANMMTKSATVNDRLKSSFYWPDDSNRESSNRRLNFNASQLQSPVSPSNSDIYSEFEEASLVVRDRKKKLLTSNIEFYDMVDTTNALASELNRSTQQQNTPKNKKMQQQTSKIEFYDYVDTPTKTGRVNGNSRNIKDSEKQPAVEEIEKSVVLAKNEVNSKKIIESRNGRQPSEGGQDENECDDKLEQINGSVKKMNLKLSKNDDDTDEEVFLKRQQQRLQAKDLNERQTPNRRRRDEVDYSDEDYENGYHRYEDERDYYTPNQRRYYQRPPDSYEEDDDEIYYVAKQRTPRYPEEYRRPPPRRLPITSDNDYDYEYHPREVRKPPISRQSSVPRRQSSPHDEPFYEDSPVTRQRHMEEANNEFDRLSAIRMNRATPSPKQQTGTSNYINDCEYYRKPNSRLSRSVSICSSIGSTNESKARAHRHLKSNIFHNNDDVYYDESNSRRPLSVRESAANNKVGVGLPDIH